MEGSATARLLSTFALTSVWLCLEALGQIEIHAIPCHAMPASALVKIRSCSLFLIKPLCATCSRAPGPCAIENLVNEDEISERRCARGTFDAAADTDAAADIDAAADTDG